MQQFTRLASIQLNHSFNIYPSSESCCDFYETNAHYPTCPIFNFEFNLNGYLIRDGSICLICLLELEASYTTDYLINQPEDLEEGLELLTELGMIINRLMKYGKSHIQEKKYYLTEDFHSVNQDFNKKYLLELAINLLFNNHASFQFNQHLILHQISFHLPEGKYIINNLDQDEPFIHLVDHETLILEPIKTFSFNYKPTKETA